MQSETVEQFWKRYWTLPPEIRRRARQAYQLWRADPSHPGLFFKRVRDDLPLYSVRIGSSYRALGVLKGDTVVWFWIGNHEDYERLIRSL